MKKIRFIAGLLIFFLILSALIIYNIRPVVHFSEDTAAGSSPKELIGREIADSVAGMLFDKDKDFPVEFSEKDINSIVTWKADKFKNKNLTGIHCSITDGKAIFYIDYNITSTLATQVILKTDIAVEGTDLKIKVEDVRLGKVGIPKALFLKAVKGKYDNIIVNSKNADISIPMNLPEQITVKDFGITDKVFFKVHISIKSKEDLISVIEFFKLKYDELSDGT